MVKPAITDRYARSRDPDVYALAERNNEGAADLANGRYPRAIVLFSQASASCREALGSDHAATRSRWSGTSAWPWSRAGRYSDGIELIEANLADRVRVLGDEDPRTLAARDALAVAYRLAGRTEDAARSWPSR